MADCTRRVTPILRTRSRSASHRLGFDPSGHHGPSVSSDDVSLTSAGDPSPSVGSRDTCWFVSGSTMKTQFSPGGYPPPGICASSGGGTGPEVVVGPSETDVRSFREGGVRWPE